jgi:hypothetical protein
MSVPIDQSPSSVRLPSFQHFCAPVDNLEDIGLYQSAPAPWVSYATTIRKNSAGIRDGIFIGSRILMGLQPFVTPVNCAIKQSFEKTSIGVIATVFNAYISGTREKIGKCSFSLIPGDSYCTDAMYQEKVISVIRLDSFARKKIQGVGTMLMQAAMEYGIAHGTEGRIALHADGKALVFYYKLGMRLGFSDSRLERSLHEEAMRSTIEHRDSVDLLNNDARPMYLPQEAMVLWQGIIRSNPVLLSGS